LGNARVLFSDLNKDGKVDGSEVLQENHYYPFGMNMEGPWCPDAVNSTKNHYQFNGIELFEDLDLNVNFAFYRSYDPAIGRWWQVDPKAESFYGMSVYNGMGNNPVMLSDPNGDSPLTSAGISVLTNGIQNLINGDNFFKGGLQAAVMGFIGGGISMGIGDAFGEVGKVGKELLRAGAHGLSGGIQSAIGGGNFLHGFASGGISSGIGSGLHNSSGLVQLAGSGLAGGLGSAIAGGDFWGGVGMGLTVTALNHAAHRLVNGGPSWEYNGETYNSKSKLYRAILLDEFAEQFGFLDIAALAGIISGMPILNTRGKLDAKNAIKGTSFASIYARKFLGDKKMPFGKRFPSVVGFKIRMVNRAAPFLGRAVPILGWGVLSWDIGVSLYNTQTQYNNIINQ